MQVRFTMMVGLPASGKTTYASSLKTKATVLSSDDIRQEMFGSGNGFTPEENSQVFGEMLKRTLEELEQKHNVVYDATNISRKRRMSTLSQIKAKYPNIAYECIVCVAPFDVCKRRNDKRWFDQVPQEKMLDMWHHFEVPCPQEGWSRIRLYFSASRGIRIQDLLVRGIDFNQKSKYHAESLGNHMLMCREWMKRYHEDASKVVQSAAFLHDIGKFDTKTVVDGEAYYYGHEHVGAYNSLMVHDLTSFGDKLHRALLIELHMRPYLYQDNDILKTKDKTLFGNKTIDEVMLIHDADMHGRKEPDVK